MYNKLIHLFIFVSNKFIFSKGIDKQSVVDFLSWIFKKNYPAVVKLLYKMLLSFQYVDTFKQACTKPCQMLKIRNLFIQD